MTMDLEHLTAGQEMLIACFPIMFGLFIGLLIAVVRYINLKDSHYKNSYKWETAFDGAFTTGVVTSYCMTFIGFLIWAIVYNWDKHL